MAWALHKTHHFTLGNKKLTVLMDHNSLPKILGDRELADIESPRILNLKQKTLCTNVSTHYHGCNFFVSFIEYTNYSWITVGARSGLAWLLQ